MKISGAEAVFAADMAVRVRKIGRILKTFFDTDFAGDGGN